MRAICLHDRDVIERVLRRNPFLHIYSLGDLDDFMWPHTTWYGLPDERTGNIVEICLLFSGLQLPTLVAVTEQPARFTELLRQIGRLLPPRFYCHLTPGLEAALETAGSSSNEADGGRRFRLDSHGRHLRMGFTRSEHAALDWPADPNVERLTRANEAEIRELYAIAYPSTWFELLMLDTELYFGYRHAGRLVAIAGVHVFAPRYHAAAVGNLATHPDFRRRGYATAILAVLCGRLLEHVDHIGLNVKQDNVPAIRCYERLGFQVHAEYGEYMVTLNACPR